MYFRIISIFLASKWDKLARWHAFRSTPSRSNFKLVESRVDRTQTYRNLSLKIWSKPLCSKGLAPSQWILLSLIIAPWEHLKYPFDQFALTSQKLIKFYSHLLSCFNLTCFGICRWVSDSMSLKFDQWNSDNILETALPCFELQLGVEEIFLCKYLKHLWRHRERGKKFFWLISRTEWKAHFDNSSISLCILSSSLAKAELLNDYYICWHFLLLQQLGVERKAKVC